jgi:hypothetical protein
MARSEERKRGAETVKQKLAKRFLKPHHYLNRRDKRAKDWVRAWIFNGTAFERLCPEE